MPRPASLLFVDVVTVSQRRAKRDHAPQHRVRDNILWGVRRGIAAAAFYTFWVICVRVIGGDAAFADLRVTLGEVVLLYVVAGVTGGAIVGLLRPFLKNAWAAYGAGLVAGIPLTAGGTIALWGWPSHWIPTDFVAAPAAAIIFGLIIGRQIEVLNRVR